MTAALEPDVCVIGAGSAGLTVAAGARAVGLSVVLVERGRMGGDCLNTGCVPSKALIAAARHARALDRAREFGIDAGPARIDAARVRAHVREVIDAIAPHDSRERFEALGATVIAASARFLDPRTVEAGGRTIRARRFVVATGSRPVLPPVPGLAAVDPLTNESVFDLDALPRRLLVVGAGPAGLELAQAFRRLGSAVTVVEADRPLANDHPDCVRVVLERLAAEGVEILAPARVVAAGRGEGGVALEVEHAGAVRRLAADRVLVAAGRAPDLADLDLEAAGIAHDGRGIVTDAALRTSNRRVFAIGDVARSYRFTHWAGYQGGLVVRSILTGWPHRQRPERIAWATYTDPEIAHVGLTEDEARARHGRAVRVDAVPFAASDRARAERRTDGLLRLVSGRRGRVLGADIAGPQASELAGLAALALAGGLTTAAFVSMIVPYPTLSELPRRAALAGLAARLADPAPARALAALRWIGRRLG